MQLLRKYLGLLVRIVISVGILAVLATKIDWAKMGVIAQTLDFSWIGLAFLFYLPVILLTAWRWQILARVQDIKMTFRQAVELGMVGQFFNSFLLGATGGDVVKIYYATQAAPSRRTAAALSVIIDRVLGLFALLIMAVVFTAVHYQLLVSTPRTKIAVYSILLISAGAVGAVAFSLVGKPIQKWFEARGWWTRIPMHGLLEKLIHAYDRFAKAWTTILWTMPISFLSHAFNLALAYFVIRALHQQPPVWEFMSTLPIMMTLAAIPISISGFGVREGLAVIFLALFGISEEHAIAFGLLSFMVSLAWNLIGGIVYLRYSTPITEQEAQAIDKMEKQALD
ncbi:hypothetical protein DB346_20760 [Verrucomicrobia bacterium LW23]|nr:hypothetical protein DB346_20760 [Verrucomicrobia bacterium LW23]